MSVSKLTRGLVLGEFQRTPSFLALCLFTAACGGNMIPIGGEPVDSDETNASTSDTTAPDDSDNTTTPGTSDDGKGDAGHDNTTGDGSSGSNAPPGVECKRYPVCDVNTHCESGSECLAFHECETAICIPIDEACKLSCPVAEECAILESYPAQLRCDGRVPAIPGGPSVQDACAQEGGKCLPVGQEAPPTYTLGNFECAQVDHVCWVPVSNGPSEPIEGVSCANRLTCDADTTCGAGETCLDFPEIGTALCISTEEACKLSCPDPSECAIAESYPGLLFCPDRIDATCAGGGNSGDAGAASGVECDQYEACDALDPCDEGSCIKVPGCEAPLCIASEVACKLSCVDADCRLAESYPEQLFCNDDTTPEPGEDPDAPVSSNDAAAAPGFVGDDGAE